MTNAPKRSKKFDAKTRELIEKYGNSCYDDGRVDYPRGSDPVTQKAYSDLLKHLGIEEK